MKDSVFLNNNEIDVINKLDEQQFKNFCFTFFEALGLRNIEFSPSLMSSGITGKGTIELGAIMSYQFVFLGKQESGFVQEQVVEELRCKMESKTNKGLILTTGSFTHQAKREAKVKGKVPVDLIDSDNLIYRLKNMKLTISTETGKVVKDT